MLFFSRQIIQGIELWGNNHTLLKYLSWLEETRIKYAYESMFKLLSKDPPPQLIGLEKEANAVLSISS